MRHALENWLLSAMNAKPLVPGTSVRWLLAAGGMAGLDIEAMIRSVSLDTGAFSDPEAMLPYDSVMDLREAIQARLGDSPFALHAGERIPLGGMGVADYVCVGSATLAHAMENLSRYFALVAHPDLRLEYWSDNDGGYVVVAIKNTAQDSKGFYEQYSVEFTFAAVMSRIRTASGRHLTPLLVKIRHSRPSYTDEYRRIFDAPIEYNADQNVLVLRPEDLNKVPRRNDTRLQLVLRSYADAMLEKTPHHDNVSYGIIDALKAAFERGQPTAEAVASRMHMSVRTLHRRLAADGTTFVRLRDDLRIQLANEYLQDHSLTIADIAYLLGYSQASAFCRAFKRWTGASPSDLRNNGRVAPGPGRHIRASR